MALDLAKRRTEHVASDWLAAVVIVGAHLAVARFLGVGDWLYDMGLDRRLDLYGNAITVTGTLVGFTLTTFTFYYAATGERMKQVREEAGASLNTHWLAALKFPMAALGLFLVIKSIDDQATGGAYGWASNARWAFEFVAVMVGLRISRLIYVFERVAGIRHDDETKSSTKPARRTLHIPPPQSRSAG